MTPVLVTGDAAAASPGIEVIDPSAPGESIIACLREAVERAAQRRPLDASERESMLTDPVLIGVAAVRAGIVHGCVAGASRPTADVVRAALRLIGMAPGRRTLSSSFVMVLPDGRTLGYGDCAVVPEPDAEQLAEIAIATAETYAAVVGDEPVIAMLSFSTKGSAEHASVDAVREATEIVHRMRPDLAVDGELQLDAALVPHVGAAKAPGSPVAGRANVLVFPNLAAGNIAYKATERLAGAEALGPLLQGLAAPVNDLSRGCAPADVLNISIITAAQALAVGEHATVGSA